MRNRLRIFLIASLACWLKLGATPAVMGAQTNQLCDDVCTDSTDCTQMCYPDLVALENGTPYISCLDWGVYDPLLGCCGDGVCDLVNGEEMCNCSADCGECTAPVEGGCDPVAQTGCGPDEYCNPLHVCKWIPNCQDGACDNNSKPSPPACFDSQCSTDADCCSGDKCTGYWYIRDWNYTVYGWCVPYTNNPPPRPAPHPTPSKD